MFPDSRSQWPRDLSRKCAAARLLRSWVRIPPGAWMFVCCECRVLSGRGLCDELITRPEESYRLWCVVVCDLETSRMRRPWPAVGRSATGGKKSRYQTEGRYERNGSKHCPSWSAFTFLVDAIVIREGHKHSKSGTLTKDSVAVFML